MKYSMLVALSAVLLAGCVPGGDPLLPELKGRWAAVRGAEVRVALASHNASVPVKTPTIDELCRSEFVTFSKRPATPEPGIFGAVLLHRAGRAAPVFAVREAKREGERIVLTGHPLARNGQTRIELILRNGAITFDNIFDQRGRSVRYDLFKAPDPLQARRANIATVGDVFRLMFDLKRCTA